MSNVLFLVDRHSFPKTCGELTDLLSLVDGDTKEIDVESPSYFFREAMRLTEDYELVIPVTRNLFIRDRLRQEGVTLVICI